MSFQPDECVKAVREGAWFYALDLPLAWRLVAQDAAVARHAIAAEDWEGAADWLAHHQARAVAFVIALVEWAQGGGVMKRCETK